VQRLRSPPLRCGATGARRPLAPPVRCHRGRKSAAPSKASGGYDGTDWQLHPRRIRQLHRHRLHACPQVQGTDELCTKDNDKGPDYRITSANGADIGAGWTKAARETGAEYLSVKLDDPSFPTPIYATLVQGDRGEHKLIRSR
jgi:hypothetical protein